MVNLTVSNIIPDKPVLPHPGVAPEMGGDELHVEAVLVYHPNGPLHVVTRVQLPDTSKVIQNRPGLWLILEFFLGFCSTLEFAVYCSN